MSFAFSRTLISVAFGGLLLGLSQPVRAAGPSEYQLCNNTSYIVDSAIGIEFQDATATQGWFRVYPGSCRSILSNTQQGERYFIHTRTPVIYDRMSEPAAISRMLCIRDENFLFAGAEKCPGEKGSLAPFSRILPGEGNDVSTVTLTEEAGYSQDSARIAGIQRLLTLAGQDPGAIDGQSNAQTDNAIDIIRQQSNLAENADDATLFVTLISAALNAGGSTGLTICNETSWQILAAIGTLADTIIVSQGWFQLPANRCTKVLRTALKGDEIQIFAEAIDENGRPASVGGNLLRWGGETRLCTKSIRFEISDHKECELRGLESTPFRQYTLEGAQGRVIWLREGE